MKNITLTFIPFFSILTILLFSNSTISQCSMTYLSANASSCTNGVFEVTGQVEFTNPPTSGTLTVTNCSGDQQIFNAPFTSPVNYSINGITADGTAGCLVNAVFSAEPACTLTTNAYTEPICFCNMNSFNVSIGACDGGSGNYKVTGDLDFVNAPSTGTLNIEVDNGVTIYDTIINPTFTSSQTWSISNIPSDGAAITVTAYFSASAGCSLSVNSTAPVNCNCVADAGTFNASIAGNGVNDYVLCFGDQIDLSSNMDYTSPLDLSIPGINYDPGIWYLAYSCPPTVFPTTPLFDNFGAPNDSCFLGVVSFDVNFSDQNIFGQPSFAGTYTDNKIYYVPITTYSDTDGYYSVTTGTGPNCYDMGAIFGVTYLSNISNAEVVDTVLGTVTVTISGGYLEFFSGVYDVANNAAGSLSSATVDSSGGSFTISGLTGGSVWDYTVTDPNGCSVTVTDTLAGSLGVSELELEFKLAPNPSMDYVKINFPHSMNADIVVLNQVGEIVLTGTVEGSEKVLSIDRLSPGLYFLRISDKEHNYSVKRFIKE